MSQRCLGSAKILKCNLQYMLVLPLLHARLFPNLVNIDIAELADGCWQECLHQQSVLKADFRISPGLFVKSLSFWFCEEAWYATHCGCFFRHCHALCLLFGFFCTLLGQLFWIKALPLLPSIGLQVVLTWVWLWRLILFTYMEVHAWVTWMNAQAIAPSWKHCRPFAWRSTSLDVLHQAFARSRSSGSWRCNQVMLRCMHTLCWVGSTIPCTRGIASHGPIQSEWINIMYLRLQQYACSADVMIARLQVWLITLHK